jgi:threonine/homoserine/homoserine lactone efflux protein
MFAQGLLLGFSIAAPVGPIGLLCIQRTLERGRRHGFASGLGAASADTLYGLLAALGLSAITTILLSMQTWLQLGGGIFLLYFGFKMARTQPAPREACAVNSASLLTAYLSVFLLTLANPVTILAFVALFAGLGLGNAVATGYMSALSLVAGVFLGSATWWLLLSQIAGWLRHRLEPSTIRLINLISGLSVCALGLWALGSLLLSMKK